MRTDNDFDVLFSVFIQLTSDFRPRIIYYLHVYHYHMKTNIVRAGIFYGFLNRSSDCDEILVQR